MGPPSNSPSSSSSGYSLFFYKIMTRTPINPENNPNHCSTFGIYPKKKQTIKVWIIVLEFSIAYTAPAVPYFIPSPRKKIAMTTNIMPAIATPTSSKEYS